MITQRAACCAASTDSNAATLHSITVNSTCRAYMRTMLLASCVTMTTTTQCCQESRVDATAA
jgi:hypothetical protein